MTAHETDAEWVRGENFKLPCWFGIPGTHELYKLCEDLGEAHDRAPAMPDKVKELDALTDGFLRDTGATYPCPNPACKPLAPKTPTQITDPLFSWKERQCKASDTLRVRNELGDTERIDSLPHASVDPGMIHSTTLEVNAGDWQELRIDPRHKGPLGTLRLYLPDTEIDFIEVTPAIGHSQRWDF